MAPRNPKGSNRVMYMFQTPHFALISVVGSLCSTAKLVNYIRVEKWLSSPGKRIENAQIPANITLT